MSNTEVAPSFAPSSNSILAFWSCASVALKSKLICAGLVETKPSSLIKPLPKESSNCNPKIVVASGVGMTVGSGKTMVIDVLQLGDL